MVNKVSTKAGLGYYGRSPAAKRDITIKQMAHFGGKKFQKNFIANLIHYTMKIYVFS